MLTKSTDLDVLDYILNTLEFQVSSLNVQMFEIDHGDGVNVDVPVDFISAPLPLHSWLVGCGRVFLKLPLVQH